MGFAQSQPAAPDPSPSVLDLPALLAEVRANNPSLRAARLDAEAQATRTRQVSALPDPMAGVTVQPFPVYTARGAQRSQWRVEQAIPFPGKRALQGDVAALGADVAGREAETLAEDLALEAKQSYYVLVRIQQQAALVASFQEQLRTFEEAAATRYEVGSGTQQAILKAQLERNRLALQLSTLAEDRQAALETLSRLAGRPLRADSVAVPPLPTPALPPPDTLLAVALQQRPEAEALRLARERAARQQALAQKQFWPDVTLSLTYIDVVESDIPPNADGRDALALGAGVKLPLWRDKLRAGVEEAQVRQRQVDARTEALEQALRTRIADLTQRLTQQRARYDLLTGTLIPQAETTLEATLSAYTTGRTDFLDLLDAERTLFRLRMDRHALAARLWSTTAALERT
ncbi:MAG: TolC family protein, partial [Bacteroidetes bacterium]|nr:TolC family protein [Bacteroidota bacterium]